MAVDELAEDTSYVPALVNILSSRLTASSTKTYSSLVGLSALELRILVILSDQPYLSAVEIAARVGQHKAPVSRSLKTLQRAGLVDIRFAAKGNRYEIAITPQGRDLWDSAMPVANEREQRLLTGFSELERKALRDFLKRMIGNLDAVAQPYEAI